MTAPTAGLPSSRVHQPQEISFNHVPDLRDLMPKHGGWPGVTYAQVCTNNVMRARSSGFSPIVGADYYSIVGTRGRAEMTLMGKGKPIPGASPDAGARMCYVDSGVEHITGHKTQPEYVLNFRDEEDQDGQPVSVEAQRDEGLPVDVAGEQGRGEQQAPLGEDRQGSQGEPKPQQQPSGGKSRGGTAKQKG